MKLIKLHEEYKKYLNWGWNQLESAEKALESVFGYHHIYIVKNSYGEPSHIFYEDKVYFFGSDVYIKNQ